MTIPDWYARENLSHAGIDLRIVATDADLYYEMALEMQATLLRTGGAARFIVPVGPTFYLERFVRLVTALPTPIAAARFFFMDEYLDANGRLLDAASPISFRGFVQRHFTQPLVDSGHIVADQVMFPDPSNPAAYDQAIADGGIDLCLAGVGITGHLAFNEPPQSDEAGFWDADTRCVALAPQTLAINANTAFGGAIDVLPRHAITVGMRQILAAQKLSIYLNRPWQRAVVRRMLYGPVSPTFPASKVQQHHHATVTLTRIVAEPPQFALK